MRLVYEDTGEEVQVGDRILVDGGLAKVDFFRPPHKPSSSGKVSVLHDGDDMSVEYYVGVIGAKWIEREDRA